MKSPSPAVCGQRRLWQSCSARDVPGRKVGFRGGWRLAMPHRRTFAAGILPAALLPAALSQETSLRHSGCRRFPPPLELTRANPPTHKVPRGTVSRERSGPHPPRRVERGRLCSTVGEVRLTSTGSPVCRGGFRARGHTRSGRDRPRETRSFARASSGSRIRPMDGRAEPQGSGEQARPGSGSCSRSRRVKESVRLAF